MFSLVQPLTIVLPTKKQVWGCVRQPRRALRYTDGRPPGAGKFAISMGNAQEGERLLVISPAYPRQAPPRIYVQ